MWQWLRGIGKIMRGQNPVTPEQTRLLARYKQLRQVGLQLNNRLVATLTKSALNERGKKLGMLKKNTLVLDSEDEIAVLMDYCLHDIRQQGANAIERYLAESPPAADSDEMVLLQALRQARFTILVLEAAEPGFGVQVRDLLRDEVLFLIDVGFSRTAPPGLMLAARIMAPQGIWQTTGAALPLGVPSAEDRAGFLRALATDFPAMDLRNQPPHQAS